MQAGEHGALHACVGDVAEVTVDLVSRLPEPLTVTNVALRLKLIQETAGAVSSASFTRLVPLACPDVCIVG